MVLTVKFLGIANLISFVDYQAVGFEWDNQLPISMSWRGIKNLNETHSVKSVRIRNYSGLYFPAFGLNTERYSYLSVFSPNVGKYGPE